MARPFVGSSAEVIRVVAPDLPVNLSVLEKNNGDAAHNINAALACGVGRVLIDGTNWKSTYSGLVY